MGEAGQDVHALLPLLALFLFVPPVGTLFLHVKVRTDSSVAAEGNWSRTVMGDVTDFRITTSLILIS